MEKSQFAPNLCAIRKKFVPFKKIYNFSVHHFFIEALKLASDENVPYKQADFSSIFTSTYNRIATMNFDHSLEIIRIEFACKYM